MFNNISNLRVYLMLTFTMLIASPQMAVSKELKDYLPQIEQTGGWYMTESAVVSGSDIKAGVVYAVIDASHDHLVSILREYSRYHELIPFLSHSTLIKRHSSGEAQLRLKAKILKGAIKLKAIVNASETKEDNLKTTFKVRKVKGNLKKLDATFSVQQLSPARSILKIELMLDPDVWYVRDRTLTDYNQVNARRIARALNKSTKQRPAPVVLLPKNNPEPANVVEAPTLHQSEKPPADGLPTSTTTSP
jgi:ribosome-associated toxin RatA of RatAB toxin-antitoxin module